MKRTIFAWTTFDINFDTLDEARKFIVDNQNKGWNFKETESSIIGDFWADKFIWKDEVCNGLSGDVTGHTYGIEVHKPYSKKINAGW